jgi:D-3-phosphoglycerate dehydrogenase / 2-oxoglutarate reductase
MPARVRLFMTEPDGFSPNALARLCRGLDVQLGATPGSRFLEGVSRAEVMWVRLRHMIDGRLMDAAPCLRTIVSPTTGLNHIDLAEARQRGIEVLSLQGETEFLKDIRATAELTIGLMLSLLRHIPAALRHVNSGGWDRDRFKGNELAGRVVGLVGYGRLGTLVARYLQAFDATVLVTDPAVAPSAVAPGVQLVSLERVLAESSLVSLHVNLNDRSENMFGSAQFAAMPAGALFVNTARGELVDDAALLAALGAGRLAGAAVDVLRGEQTRQSGEPHPLVEYAREHANLLITPHIGGCTAESMEKTEHFMVTKLEKAMSAWNSAPPVETLMELGQRSGS